MTLQDKLKTWIFLDSGDPQHTKSTLEMLGFVDGQTTNPSLVAKNPKVQDIVKKEGGLTNEILLEEYKKIVEEIRGLIPQKSVSIEVYADKDTTAEEMIEQARQMNRWIPDAHIKIPTIHEGLKAAHQLVQDGFNINMTLVFTQEQAAAIYAATRGAGKGQVYVSPFEGRLFDDGTDGMDVIYNIQKMYDEVNAHTMTLAASIRSVEQLMYILHFDIDIVTVPFKIIMDWYKAGLPLVEDEDKKYNHAKKYLKEQNHDGTSIVPYQQLDLDRDWQSFDIRHHKTDEGLQKFADDWNNLLR